MAPKTGDRGPGVEVAPDVLSLQTLIANVCLVGMPGAANDWVLVDTGMGSTVDQIRQVAEERFGADHPPVAILLTHGHFDHVGGVEELSRGWDVPVYAHPQELPYLTGQLDYPPPDPTVGGGLISTLSPLFPHNGIDLGERIRPLPADGAVPGMPGWRWIATPGHTPGHVAFFRPSDRVLIAGDAFITTNQESALAVLLKEHEINGPPAYFTTNWTEAREAVQRLAALQPTAVATGHGLPMRGEELAKQLAELAADFDRLAVPDQGRYVTVHRSQ